MVPYDLNKAQQHTSSERQPPFFLSQKFTKQSKNQILCFLFMKINTAMIDEFIQRMKKTLSAAHAHACLLRRGFLESLGRERNLTSRTWGREILKREPLGLTTSEAIRKKEELWGRDWIYFASMYMTYKMQMWSKLCPHTE